jgi:ATP-dependent Clp protease ATP-binding subunit ClpA
MLGLEIFTDKIADSAKRLLNQAYQEARQREHHQLADAHVLFAISEQERSLFHKVMQSLNLDPQVVLLVLDAQLDQPKCPGRSAIQMSESFRILLCKALKQAHEHNRRFIDSNDLFIALFEDKRSSLVTVFERLGAEPERIIPKIQNQIRNRDNTDSQTQSDQRGHR